MRLPKPYANVSDYFIGWDGQGLVVPNTASAEWRDVWKTITPAERRILEAVLRAGGGDLGISSAQRVNDPEGSAHKYGYALDFSTGWDGSQKDPSTLPVLLRTFYHLANTWRGGVGIAYDKRLHLHVDDRLLLYADTINGKDSAPKTPAGKAYWSDRRRGFPFVFAENWTSGNLVVEPYSPEYHDPKLLPLYGVSKSLREQIRDSFKQTISDTADDVGQWIDNRFDAILPDAGFGWGVFVGLGLSAAGLYAWHKHGPGLAKAVPLIVDAARTRKKLFRLKKKAG